jgi:hypothetical protein
MRDLNKSAWVPVRSKTIAPSSISSNAQSLEHIVGVPAFHKPLALFAFLKHLQGFFIRYFHGKGQANDIQPKVNSKAFLMSSIL